jgi:peptidoglycan/LPS O-acetylase OafA/YrhL
VLILMGLAILGILGVVQLISNAQAHPEIVREALANPGTALQKLGLVVPVALEYAGVVTVFNYNAWALALLVMAFGIARFNYNNRTLKTTGEFSMPFYVIHHPFVVVLGFYVVSLNWGAVPQMLLLGVTALIGTLAVVAFLIAPWNPLRMILGMSGPSRLSRRPTEGSAGVV